MRIAYFLVLPLSVCGSALALAQAPAPAAPASAPAAARDVAPTPERVIVTGTGFRQTAASVPFNISAISEESLRQQNIGDLKSLVQLLPSINAPGNSARFADSVTVRGLNVSPVNANNIEQFTRSTVAYYLDDTPLPNIALRLKDVARVETLLGPQGTLYGSGSLGGTIRYITNKPQTGTLEGRISTSLYQTRGGGLSNDSDGMINVPLGTSVALRASVARLDEKGYTDRVSTPPWRDQPWSTKPNAGQNVYEDDDWQKVDTGRAALLFKATKALSFTLAHSQQDQLANGTTATSVLPLSIANATTPAQVQAAWRDPSLEIAGPYTDPRTTPVAVNDHTVLARWPEFARRKLQVTSFDIDWDLGFADLHSSTSTFKDSRIGQADYASQGWTFYYSFGDLGGDITSDRSAYITFDNTYKGVNHETRLTSKGEGPLQWVAGVYHTRQDKNLRFNELLPGMDAYLGTTKARPSPQLADLGYSEDLGSRYRETALFGEATYRVIQPWTVTLGARVFNYEDTADVNIIDWAGGFVDNQYTATGKASSKSFFKLNTAWRFTPDLLSYATVSQGFRRGGINGFRDQGSRIVAPDARNYEPDSTTNYELGAKGYVAGKTLFLQAALFRIDWKDTQTYFSQDVNGFPVNGTANGPDSRSEGVELAARWQPTAQWQFSYSGERSKAQWVDTKRLCLYANGTGCRTWAEGGLLGGAPTWTHRAGVQYSRDLFGDLYLRSALNARYLGKVRSDRSDSVTGNADVFIYPAITTVNASIAVGGAGWEAQLWVDNVADERKLDSTQSGGVVMGQRLMFTKPRTVGLNLSYAF
jgi:iron complex outermembrane recepter protein